MGGTNPPPKKKKSLSLQIQAHTYRPPLFSLSPPPLDRSARSIIGNDGKRPYKEVGLKVGFERNREGD